MWSSLKTKWKQHLVAMTTKYDRDKYISRDILQLCGQLRVTEKLLAHQLELFRRVTEEGYLA